MLNKLKIKSLAMGALAMAGLASCGASGDNPGREYAPQMYHSVPYEPLSQITDESQGKWLSTRADERGEFYNSNPYNEHNMNMRVPAENTVPRRGDGLLPYRYPKDSVGSTYYLDLAARTLKNPLPETEDIAEQGRILYANFCVPCHGGAGAGDGPVGMVYKGVPNFSGGRYAEMTEGHVFHVITHGQGRMWPYASQIAPIDRWKITRYVQTLQKQ
jgi:mono/diheme cytochrome c family protein